MKTALVTLALLGSALTISGCAREAGGGDRQDEVGQSIALSMARQVAYKTPDDFLTDLGRVFAAETEDTVTFAFNQATLDATARRALDGQAAWLRANPNVRMRVEGHTDAVGGETYNDRLGLRRARAVVAYLARRGVSRTRLDAVDTFGETQLVVDTPDRERRNRRAVTRVAGFVRNFVGTGLDGTKVQASFNSYRADSGAGTTADLNAGLR
ncbi:MAG: OmpA family protein [Pikeienuella sp.]